MLIRDTVLVIFDFTRRNVGMAALEVGVQHVGWRVQLELALLWVGVGWGGVGRDSSSDLLTRLKMCGAENSMGSIVQHWK